MNTYFHTFTFRVLLRYYVMRVNSSLFWRRRTHPPESRKTQRMCLMVSRGWYYSSSSAGSGAVWPVHTRRSKPPIILTYMIVCGVTSFRQAVAAPAVVPHASLYHPPGRSRDPRAQDGCARGGGGGGRARCLFRPRPCSCSPPMLRVPPS